MQDAIGQTHAPAQPGARIVSLVPSITELLFALGLGDQVVGRTGFCVHPEQGVKSVQKVGGTKDVKLDAIRALAPSHVIVNIDENTRQTYDALAAFVPHVVVTHPCAPQDNVALYQLLGQIFGCADQAETLLSQLNHELAQLPSGSSAPQRVLYLIWKDPWMTISADTYIARMLELIGWEAVGPAGATARYPQLTPADMAGRGIDRVLLSSEPYSFAARHVAEAEQAFGAPAQLVRGDLLSWYGSRAIEGVRYLRTLAAAA